jgi:IS5 family transposase
METPLIVEQHVTQHTDDKQEVVPARENLAALPETLGEVTHLVADAGYDSEANVEACEGHGVEPVLAVGRASHHPPVWDPFIEPLPPPEDVDAVTRMRYRLRTPEGKRRYARRKGTIEPVFGILQHGFGFRQFLLRGIEAVKGEWTRLCMAWNLKRLHTLRLTQPGGKVAYA